MDRNIFKKITNKPENVAYQIRWWNVLSGQLVWAHYVPIHIAYNCPRHASSSKKQKKIGFDYILKLLSMNTIFYFLFETSSFTGIPAYRLITLSLLLSATEIRFYSMNKFGKKFKSIWLELWSLMLCNMSFSCSFFSVNISTDI